MAQPLITPSPAPSLGAGASHAFVANVQTPTVKPDPQVKVLQRQLKKAGAKITVDGVAGPETAMAAQTFLASRVPSVRPTNAQGPQATVPITDSSSPLLPPGGPMAQDHVSQIKTPGVAQVPEYQHLKAPSEADITWAQMTGQTPDASATGNQAFHQALANSTTTTAMIIDNVLTAIGQSAVPKAPTSLENIVNDLLFFAPASRPIKGLDAIVQGVRAARDSDEALGLLTGISKAWKDAGPIDRAAAARTTDELHPAAQAGHAALGDGYSIDVHGQPAVTKRYVYAYKPQESVLDNPSVGDVSSYMKLHEGEAAKPGNFYGGWRGPDGKAYLDVSTSTDSLPAALRLAKKNGQKAIYDTGTGNDIFVPTDEQMIVKALSEDATGRYKVENLPNGFTLVEDRSSGLAGLFNADGSKRSGDFRLPALSDVTTKSRARAIFDSLASDQGSLNPAAFAQPAYNPRTAKYGDFETQFPQSNSRITNQGQRTLDRAGEKLAPVVDELRQSEHASVRLAGKALTPASARGRVAKQAGKNMRQQVKRAQARLAHHAKLIHSAGHSNIPVIRHGGASFAHWWYAQLPHDLRNVKGLKLLRGKVNDELEYVSRGTAFNDLAAEIDEAKLALEEARKAGDTTAVFEHMRHIRQVKAMQRDLPRMMRDIENNIKKFDKVIAKPIEVNHSLIASMSALSKERERLLVDAGKLHPTQAGHRAGLVSKWLGLEPTGEEVYVGHRMAKNHGSQSSFPSVGLGRVKAPDGVGRINTRTLISTGRARHDLGHIVEDWQAAQSYAFANMMRKELGQLGKPFEGEVPKGYSLVNPKGQTVDRKWKVDVNDQTKAEGFDKRDIEAQDLIDYIKNVIADGKPEQEEMLKHALDHGYAKDLRIVPDDVVSKYIGQWQNPKLLAGTPGLTQAAKVASKVTDNINNAIYTSLIYANPGYIPSNFLQNLILAGAHQGAFLPINLSRAGQIMAQASPKLKDMILAEVGEGATVAAASGTGHFRNFASNVQKVADNPSRISAFIHELGRAGVISKTKPTLTKTDFANIEKWMLDPNNLARLNDAKDAAVQSQVDFERLGPNERAITKKIFFVWGWLRGATRYPGRFALDHPVRTGVGAYALAGAPGAPQGVQDKIHDVLPNIASGMPPYLAGAFEAGKTTIDGTAYPQVYPTRAISPISTPLELLDTAINQKGSQSVGQMLNPGITAAWDIAHHDSPYGRSESYTKSATDAAARLVPEAGLAQDLIHPPSSKNNLYPNDSTRLGRIERATRVLPVAINPEKAFQARVLAGEEDSYHVAVHNLIRDSMTAGMGDPPESVLNDLKWYTRLTHQTRRATGDDGRIDYVKAAQETAKLYDERYGGHETEDQADALETQGDAATFYHILAPQLYPEYEQWKSITESNLALVKQGQSGG